MENPTSTRKRGQLNDFDRAVMDLRGKGYHQAEIAQIYGVSQSAISQRLKKIRKLSKIEVQR